VLTNDKSTKWQNKNAFIFSKEYFQKKVLLNYSKNGKDEKCVHS
jgi:hypothetical protein